MKTERKIIFSSAVQPIRLGSSYIEEGKLAVSSGWGYTSNPGSASSDLQWIQVETLDEKTCKNKMSKSNAAKVFESTICTVVVDEEGGNCMGDSGGK
jgi:hypothetical protein